MKLGYPVLFISGVLGLAACGQLDSNGALPQKNYWTQAEIDKVSDLQDLGTVSFKDEEMYLGNRPVRGGTITGKYYGINKVGTTGYTVTGFDTLSEAEQNRLKNMSPQEIDQQFQKLSTQSVHGQCWSVFCKQSSETVSTQALGYNIDSSRTNLYADFTQCADPNVLNTSRRIIFKNATTTQPNRTSYYLALDTSIYDGTQLKAKDFAQSGGNGAPTSGVFKESSTSEIFCFLPRSPEGRGWHKGIEKNGEASIIVTRSDTVY